jgi:hypothetical protein
MLYFLFIRWAFITLTIGPGILAPISGETALRRQEILTKRIHHACAGKDAENATALQDQKVKFESKW